MHKEKFFKLISGVVAVVFFITSSAQAGPLASLTPSASTLRPSSATIAGASDLTRGLIAAAKRSSVEQWEKLVSLPESDIAAIKAELSPKGTLSKFRHGAVMTIGDEINLIPVKNGEVYPGEHNEIKRLGHNLVSKEALLSQLKSSLERIPGSYVYTNFMTRGNHPRYLNGEEIQGDLEDRRSGPELAKRFAKELLITKSGDAKQIKGRIKLHLKSDFTQEYPDVDSILSIFVKEEKLTKKEEKLKATAEGAILRSVSEVGRSGNELARRWIKETGREIGQALAAFFAAYHKEDFIEHMILVSGVNEKMGKGSFDELDRDLYVGAIKDSVGEELKKYGIDSERIGKIVDGVERSDMTYEREFLAFTPEKGVDIALSMGGDKIAVNLVNEKGELLIKAKDQKGFECKWRKELKISPETPGFHSEKNADKIMDLLTDLIEKALKEAKGMGVIEDISSIVEIGVAFAGPVDSEKGVAGTPFKTPNQPFVNYPFVKALQSRIAKKFKRSAMPVELINDCQAALRGELSKKGKLHKYGFGAVMIVGGGINIATAKNGKIYFGRYNEIREVGHIVSKELFEEAIISQLEAHPGKYVYTGLWTRGDLPRDLQGEDIKGDLVDGCSGPGLAKRFAETLLKDKSLGAHQIKDKIELHLIEDKELLLDFPEVSIKKALGVLMKKGELTEVEEKLKLKIIDIILRSVTEAALDGDGLAKEWIKQAGTEIGQALAAFIAAYKDEDFVKHIILASEFNKRFGRGVIEDGQDLYLKTIRDAVRKELTLYGISLQTAKKRAEGIVRSEYAAFSLDTAEGSGVKSSSVGQEPDMAASLGSLKSAWQGGAAVKVITSRDEAVRDTIMEDLFEKLNTEQLLAEAEALEEFVSKSDNLYHKARACMLLKVLYGIYLYARPDLREEGRVDFAVVESIGNRRYEEALKLLHDHLKQDGYSKTVFTYIAGTYDSLMFEFLTKQVENSIQALPENRWMFEIKDLAEYAKRVKVMKAMLEKDNKTGKYPVLHIAAPTRIELNSTVGSDIFFLAMDRPKNAKVINISADLSIWGSAKKAAPPINVYLRIIDKPVIRLTSVDLKEQKDVDSLDELFNFRNDYLSSLKASIIASGIVPFGFQGRKDITLKDILKTLLGQEDLGFEFVTHIHAGGKPIPRSSGLAISTMLLVAGIDAGMKFSGQMEYDDERITEEDKGTGTVRTVFGEHIGGSGGGWQDSGGQWGGIKLCEAQLAQPGDPEFGVSAGRLLPKYITMQGVSKDTRKKLVDSIVLVHGGATQDAGPVLQDVTREYLLRRNRSWQARLDSEKAVEEQIKALEQGDIKAVAAIEDRDWINKITIVPLADNAYIDTMVARLREMFGEDFWGADSTGCRGGAGHIFFVNPKRKKEFVEAFYKVANELRGELRQDFPIPVEPTAYDFNINDKGITANLLKGRNAVIPRIKRQKGAARVEEPLPEAVQKALEHSRASNEAKLTAYKNAKITLEKNRGWVKKVESATRDDLVLRPIQDSQKAKVRMIGAESLRNGEAGELILAAGVGARFTGGETAKPTYPILKVGGRYYSFIHFQAAKTKKVANKYNVKIPHIVHTGHATEDAIVRCAKRENNFGLGDDLIISRSVNLSHRAYPRTDDLAYVRQNEAKTTPIKEALRDKQLEAEISWASSKGEAGLFVPAGVNKSNQFNPPGHFYWLWDTILSGALGQMLNRHPNMKYLFIHNVDNLLATIDEETLGLHKIGGREGPKVMSAEVSAVTYENCGGGLYWFTLTEQARQTLGIDKNRILGLLEAPASPTIPDEFKAKFFNIASYWITIDEVFKEIGITRKQVIEIYNGNQAALQETQKKLVAFEQRLPTYVTVKRIVEDYGGGVRDVMPVSQFEKFWGDISWLIPSNYILSGTDRSVHIKEIAHRNLYLDRGLMKNFLPQLPALPTEAVYSEESAKFASPFAKSSSAGENFSKDAPFSENNPMPRQDKTQWDMDKAMSLTLGEKILTRALDIHTEHIIELKTLEEIAIKAADILVEYRKRHPGKIDIMHKDMADDGDPLTTAVTELDIRVQDFYINQLHQIFPSWKFVAEEGVAPELSNDGKADYVCMIDPIDGTSQFARRSEYDGWRFQPMFKHIEYGTGIALLKRLADGRLKPVISIGILPEIDIDGVGFTIAEAVDDIEGAFLNGKKVRISSLTHSQLKRKDVIIEPRRDQKETAEKIAREFRKGFLDVCSLCHFILIASGAKDIVAEMSARPQVWDAVIGGFIAQKAGARVVYLNDGNNLFPIDPKRIDKDFRTDSIFAADPETVSYVFGQLKDTSDSRPGIKPASELIERGARIYTSIRGAA